MGDDDTRIGRMGRGFIGLATSDQSGLAPNRTVGLNQWAGSVVLGMEKVY